MFKKETSDKNILKIHIVLKLSKEMNAESYSAQTGKDFASKAGVPFIRINMGERRNCMSADPVRAARIKSKCSPKASGNQNHSNGTRS